LLLQLRHNGPCHIELLRRDSALRKRDPGQSAALPELLIQLSRDRGALSRDGSFHGGCCLRLRVQQRREK